MKLSAELFLFCLKIQIGRQEYSNLWKVIIFSIFSHLGHFHQEFEQVKQ